MSELNAMQAVRKQKILVVDDHEELRRLIALTLRRHYVVSEACDAAQALAALAQDKPDGLILDVMMPGEINGFQLCERIKRTQGLEHIHVIMVTARGQEHDVAVGKAMGADAYFVKPFSPLALLRHLENAFGAE